MISSFWRGKKVFLTGHTGFKGSWMALLLKNLGAEVFGYSLPALNPSLYHLAQIRKDIVGEDLADLNDLPRLKNSLHEFKPNIIFHFAAQAFVRKSYIEPLETLQTNIIGTANLLEVCRSLTGLNSVVIVTTDKCYENTERPVPYVETDPLGGYDPYSGSKACAEIVTHSYRRSFFQHSHVGIASARAGNVHGGGDFSEDRLVPDLIRSLQSRQALKIRSPKSIRPWQHVLEPLAGYLLLAENLASSKKFEGGWNFGPPREAALEVEQVTKEFQSFFPELRWQTPDSPLTLHEAKILMLNSEKAQNYLGWERKLAQKESFQWTARWYEQFFNDPSTLREFSLRQIKEFQEK